MQADVLRAPVGPGAMHVERYGHGGAAVVLLHGFGTCNFLWRAVAPEITESGNTAYAIDPFVGPDGANHLLALASSINDTDLDEDDLRNIQAPTLIVWGEEDKWCDA